MIILDCEYLKKYQNQRNKFKNMKSRMTHLYMNSRKITEIDDISKYSGISVAYLHDNLIEDYGQLCLLKNLTHLYLQWNNLRNTQNLNHLPNLTHLYLGYNFISNLNGLKAIPRLEVLHLQKQNSQNGSSLHFDPETLSALSKSLQELNISDNNLTSLAELKTLRQLIILDISDNLLSDLEDVCNALMEWKRMKNLKICGNLITKRRKYEHNIIATAFSLDILNGKEISNTRRVFLQALLQTRNKKSSNQVGKKTDFSSETQSFVHQLPLEFREVVSRSIIHKRKDEHIH